MKPLIKQCPICNSKRIKSDRKKSRCDKCGYVHKTELKEEEIWF